MDLQDKKKRKENCEPKRAGNNKSMTRILQRNCIGAFHILCHTIFFGILNPSPLVIKHHITLNPSPTYLDRFSYISYIYFHTPTPFIIFHYILATPIPLPLHYDVIYEQPHIAKQFSKIQFYIYRLEDEIFPIIIFLGKI